MTPALAGVGGGSEDVSILRKGREPRGYGGRVGRGIGTVIGRFDAADETREFDLGTFSLVSLGGITVGRASYEPG